MLVVITFLIIFVAFATATPSTVYVIDIGTYCSTDRAVPYYLPASLAGATLAPSEASSQATCVTSQSFNPFFMQNSASGNIYAIVCGILPATGGWQSPTYVDSVPPCSIGWSGCQPGQFNNMGYTAQTLCTGQYLNAEQFPPANPPNDPNPCFPISGCSPIQGQFWAVLTGQSPSDPTQYYIFLYNCFTGSASQMGSNGYTNEPSVGCNNFSQYRTAPAPAKPGAPQKSATRPLLTGGAIAGVVIGGLIVAVLSILYGIPPLRELLVAKSKESVAKMKEMTGTSMSA